SPRPCTNASARVARQISRTECSPPCASSSEGTWRNLLPGNSEKEQPQERTAHHHSEASMNIEVFADAESVAHKAARIIAARARDAVVARGRFILAVSGGHTPWLMLRDLAGEKVPWEEVHLVQVDERVAPAGHPDRNLTHLRESLLTRVPLRPEQIH